MLMSEWIDLWEEKVPLGLQEEWDNSGLQAGRTNRELEGIVLALDLTDKAIDMAEDRGANLIMTHHPILFSPEQQISEKKDHTRLIIKALERGISIYASHTNFDTVNGGVNDVLAEKCQLTFLEALDERQEDQGYLNYSRGMGVVGSVEKQRLEDYARTLKENFDLDHLILYGDLDAEIERVGVLGGSGMSYADKAISKGCQLLVTADAKYHDSVDAVGKGLNIIDLGHYNSEHPAMYRMEEWANDIEKDIVKAVVEEDAMRERKIL